MEEMEVNWLEQGPTNMAVVLENAKEWKRRYVRKRCMMIFEPGPTNMAVVQKKIG